MRKHFVTFYSPGTFFSESTIKEIDSWDVSKAIKISLGIRERYNATPYGFRFSTRESDGREISTSNMYFLGGKIETLRDVETRNNPDEKILLCNMKSNGLDKIIVNTNSWKITLPFEEGDVLIENYR